MSHAAAQGSPRLHALDLVSQLRAAADRLAAGADPEALHDVRVALRRLRTTLRVHRPWTAGGPRRKDEARLARLAAATGAERDAEVGLAWLRARRRGLAPAARSGALRLAAALSARQREARAGRPGLLARLERAARKTARRLREGAGEGTTPRLADAEAARRLLARARAAAEAIAAVQGPADVEGAHRARVRGKALRYLAEPLRDHPRAGRAARALVARLARVQDVFGELHDAHVLAAEARALAAASPRGRAGLLALARALDGRARRVHAGLEAAGAGALAAAAGRVAAALDPRTAGRYRRAR